MKKYLSSLSTGGGESAPNLEGIVDNPLHASKGTNHENSGSETLPESVETNILVDLTSTLSGLVHDRDHGVSWMRDDGAENTGNITRHEGDHKLGSLAVFALWLGEDVGIEFSDDLLESDELDDGIWNLSHPKWLDTLVETGGSFCRFNLVESGNTVSWESSLSGGLHSNFGLYTY